MCRAQSTNETLPVPTQPAFSTPVLSSSVNQTSSSVNQRATPSATSSFNINEVSTVGVNVTSSTGLNLTASVATSPSSAQSVIATSSPRSILSSDGTEVNQYRSSTSGGTLKSLTFCAFHQQVFISTCGLLNRKTAVPVCSPRLGSIGLG